MCNYRKCLISPWGQFLKIVPMAKLHSLKRGHSITTWTRGERGSKNVCFCSQKICIVLIWKSCQVEHWLGHLHFAWQGLATFHFTGCTVCSGTYCLKTQRVQIQYLNLPLTFWAGSKKYLKSVFEKNMYEIKWLQFCQSMILFERGQILES